MSGWVYRVGLGEEEVSEESLKRSGLKYELVEVEQALRAHIPETLDKTYKFYTSMREDAPNIFSCSSLISYLYIFAGVWMPSVVIDKYFYLKKINKDDLRFGDIIFSTAPENAERPQRKTSFEYKPGELTSDIAITHAVMYLGNGEVLNASDTRGQVIIEKLEESPIYPNIVSYARVVENLKEKRWVIEIPDNKPELRSKNVLLDELRHLS